MLQGPHRAKILCSTLVVTVLDLQLGGPEFNFWPPRLVLGWVTGLPMDKPAQHIRKPPGSTQPPTLGGTGNEYTSQSEVMLCGWGAKADMAHCSCV